MSFSVRELTGGMSPGGRLRAKTAGRKKIVRKSFMLIDSGRQILEDILGGCVSRRLD